MSYSLMTLWNERQRFLPAVMAVAFSALLLAMQSGLLWGSLAVVSLPVDHAAADVWVGSPDLDSVEAGQPIPQRWGSRLNLPEVERFETYQRGFTDWHRPGGGTLLCMVVGSHLHDRALGAVRELTPELRARLHEPGSVVVDAAELGQLGLKHGVGESVEVGRQRVRVVGLVRGLKALTVPYVFCSLETARRLLNIAADQTTFLLARCHDPADAAAVVRTLRRHANLSAYTKDELSLRSRYHWLFKTGAGVVLAVTTALGLLVGAVITSQTLYGATVASLREYAVLHALGIPRRRMAAAVLAQSFWVGVGGLGLAVPLTTAGRLLAEACGAPVLLGAWLAGGAGVLTLATALASGLVALRSLRLVEPALLLR
jgi:putative ABC transport system permease protein